jgi:hypothetical protein
VTYQGYAFTVPRSWPVVDLAAHPRQCVRFDRHVLYLGTPGRNQDCPAALVGTTEAVLVQPSAAHAIPDSVAYPVDRLIAVVTRRITITATYSTDRARIDSILSSASLRMPSNSSNGGPPADVPPERAAGPVAAPRVLPATATNYTGRGFDACTAPSPAEMQTWRRFSPYRAVGIYIGGADRACAQPNLTSSWISQQQAAGWHFMPIYVGPQASFGEISSPASQATSAAKDAVSQARSLGFGPRTPIYYDMEAYSSTLTRPVLRFLTAWTREVHALGYTSGIYSNSLSGVIDLVNNYTNSAYTMPDVIYDALWNGQADTKDPILPASDWALHHRIHQYQGGVNVTYGGDTINIDQDYLDVQLATPVTGGGTPQASQAAAQVNGNVDAFFQGSNGALWHDWFSPRTGWHGPASMGGSLAAQPSAVASLPGSVAVFGKGTDGGLWESAATSTTSWSRLKRLNMGTLGSGPAAVAQSNGTIDVFWRGSADDHLWYAEYRLGSGWTGPHDLGGHLASGPAPALSGGGTVSVFWTGTDGHLWDARQNPGSAWTRPASLGMGRLGGAPSATGLASGVIDVFWPASSHASVWHVRYTPATGWGKASSLSGGVSAGPAAVSSAANSVNVFWRGTDGRLWWAANQGGAWSQPVPLGMGVLGTGPFAAGQRSGVVDVFWKGSADPHLWHARYSGGSWAGPGDLGGAVS